MNGTFSIPSSYEHWTFVPLLAGWFFPKVWDRQFFPRAQMTVPLNTHGFPGVASVQLSLLSVLWFILNLSFTSFTQDVHQTSACVLLCRLRTVLGRWAGIRLGPTSFVSVFQRSLSFIAWCPGSWKPLFCVLSTFWLFQAGAYIGTCYSILS